MRIETLQLSRSDYSHLFFAFSLTLTIMFFFAPLWINDFEHESVVFKPATDLVEGKMVFKDSFTQYGPLCVLIQAAVIKLYGKYLVVVKYQAAFFYALTAIMLWLVWRRFCPAWMATLGILLWNLNCYHFHQPFLAWASTYALFFQTLVSLCLFLGLEKGRSIYFFLAGTACAACFFCKQNVGGYRFVAAIVFLAAAYYVGAMANRKRRFYALFIFGSGFLTIFAIFIAWFLMTGALEDWWLQNIVWPKKWASIYGNRFDAIHILRNLFLIGGSNTGGSPDWLFRALPLSCLGLCVAYPFLGRVPKSNSRTTSAFLFTFLCFASWLQYFPVPGIGHLWWSASPMFGVALYVLFESFRKLPEIRTFTPTTTAWVFVTMLCASQIPILYHHVYTFRAWYPAGTTQVQGDGPLAGIWIAPEKARAFEALERVIDAHVNSRQEQPYVFLDSNDGIVLTFVDNLRPVHRMWMSSYRDAIDHIYPTFRDSTRETLRSESPIVFSRRNANAVEKFLKANPQYKIVAEVKTKEGADGSVVILMDEAHNRL